MRITEVRARPGQVAATRLIPGVLQNRGHLAVVPYGDELPIVSQERRGRERFGEVHLRRLVYH